MRSGPRVFSICESEIGALGPVPTQDSAVLPSPFLVKWSTSSPSPPFLTLVDHAAGGAVGIVGETLDEFADLVAVLVTGHGNKSQ